MDTTAFFEQVEKIKMPVRIVIFCGTILLLISAFVYFLYLPKVEECNKTEEEIVQLEQKLNQARVRAKRRDALEKEYAQVDDQYKEALKLLPDSKEIPSLLTTLSRLGAEASLDIRHVRLQQDRPKDFYFEIPVSLEVSGPYHNVAVFFDKVGGMERIVNILNVSMRPIQASSTTLVTTCDAVTYRFKGETDVTETKKQNKKK
ncbi:MAG: type 4a pilus biogenesis protein PilO [Deltaproteobacteria bacterium]|nr:type 4a pilus biogenesis protein PilO [Deltaproteobacteria bacterium]